MAQPVVSQRPATWAGTSLPIIYKLTSTNYALAGYRLEVEIWDSTAAAKIADAKYYANGSGVVTVDISSFLSSSMRLDNNSDFTYDIISIDNNWIKYYIKYREVWTASSETQVNDSANFRFAIYGGLQIGITNDMTDLNILTSSAELSEGEYGTVSFKNRPAATLRIQKYLNGGSVSIDDTSMTTNEISRVKVSQSNILVVDQVDISFVSPALTLGTLSTFANGGTGTDWTTGVAPYKVLSAAFEHTKHLYAAFAMATGVDYSIAYNITVVDVDLRIVWCYLESLDSSFNALDSVPIYDLSGSGVFSGTAVINSPSGIPAYLGVRFTVDDAVSGTGKVTVNSLTHTSAEQVFDRLSIAITEPCDETVTLQWKNPLGGDEFYSFKHNQDYSWHYSNRKAKRLTLYADNLTLDQWETIQQLNTLGELYKTPIVEMTTSVNRTSATIGQSVYVLNSDGTKTGVNVIGQSNTTRTKNKTHSAIVTIEYPELFLQ